MRSIAVLLLAAVAYGQDCEMPIQGFAQCVMEEMTALKADKMAAKEEMMVKKSACFVDNNCEDPMPVKKSKMECVKGVIADTIGPELDACLTDKGVAVPEEFMAKMLEKGAKWGGHRKFGRKGGKGDKSAKKEKWIQKILDRFCQKEDQPAVRDCVTAVKSEFKAKFGGRGGMLGGKLAVIAKCKDQLSPACLPVLMQKKQGMCECGQALAENEELATALTDGYNECKTDAGFEVDEDQEESMGTKKLRKFVKMLCRMPKFPMGPPPPPAPNGDLPTV